MPKTISESSSDYSVSLLKRLNDQRLCGSFCDLTVRVADVSFYAHRSLLMATSDKLMSLLLYVHLRSNYEDVLIIDNIDPVGFQIILDFIYTGRVTLMDSVNIHRVLHAAIFLNIPFVQYVCQKFLGSDIASNDVELTKALEFGYKSEHSVKSVLLADTESELLNQNVSLYELGLSSSIATHLMSHDMVSNKQSKHCRKLQPNLNTFLTESMSETVVKTEIVFADAVDEQTLMSEGVLHESSCKRQRGRPPSKRAKLLSECKQNVIQRSKKHSCSVEFSLPLDNSQKRKFRKTPPAGAVTKGSNAKLSTSLSKDILIAETVDETTFKKEIKDETLAALDSIRTGTCGKQLIVELQRLSEHDCGLSHTIKLEPPSDVIVSEPSPIPASIVSYDGTKKLKVKKKRDHRKIISADNHDYAHICTVCERKFKRLSDITRHMHDHENLLFTCRYCSVQFTKPVAFKSHNLKAHNDPRCFCCAHPGCKIRKSSLCDLKLHGLIHIEFGSFQCSWCGRAFHHKNGLESHLRSCKQMLSFMCDFCGQKFNHPQSMKNHVNAKHVGVKPFQCTDCGAQFVDRGNFKRHLRIHRNLFPYSCSLCDQKFRHSNSLKTHIERHDK